MNITFVVPMLNEEKHIRYCIEAIISEMEDNDSLIVVDNGSTDMSPEICKQYDKVKLLHMPKCTIGAVRNFGARSSNSELVAFIDADCTILKGWRGNVISAINQKGVAAVGSKYKIPPNANMIERAWYSQRNYKISRVKYINSGNLVVKRRIFEQLGGFNEGLITGEDTELGWRINKAGYVMIDDPSIQCVHYGNPKDIKGFYAQQKWHATGMMGTFRISSFDKPVIMTVLFILSAIFSAILALEKVNWMKSILLLTWVPVTTAIFRTVQYLKPKYFISLVFLYLIYFIARAHALIDMALSSQKRN